jgi:segregation and condensation protein B
MDRTEMMHAVEALLFAAATPLSLHDLKRIFERIWADEPLERRNALMAELKAAFADLTSQAHNDAGARGFTLVQVAEGLSYRSNPRYAHVLRAMREEKPQRLSQAALETLAIVAYRQPATKPEIDDIRGVDCGATLRLLLERGLIRIVGKKEEPGRPMLYATTKAFLSLFNLGSLAELPSLREFHELTPNSEEEIERFDEAHPSLKDLSEKAKKLRLEDEPAVAALDEAVSQLATTEKTAREALEARGIRLDPLENESQAPESASTATTSSAAGGPPAPPAVDPSAEAREAPAHENAAPQVQQAPGPLAPPSSGEPTAKSDPA